MSLGELLTASAYAVGALVFYLAARERGMATQGMGRLAAIGLIFGILGAKVTQVVAGGGGLEALWSPSLGGRALLGGLVFGWLAVEAAKWRMGIRSSTGPMFALALPAGEAVGRIGCHFNGCCHGVPSDVPWAVVQHGAARHPAQLYAAALSLLLFLALFAVRKRFDGKTLFRLFLLGWGLERFAVEFVREGSRTVAGLTMMQLFAAEIVALAAVGLILAARAARRSETALVPQSESN